MSLLGETRKNVALMTKRISAPHYLIIFVPNLMSDLHIDFVIKNH